MRHRLLRVLVFLCVLLGASSAFATERFARADGNLTAAATWGAIDATSSLTSTSASVTALTTSTVFSSTFTPGAITVDTFGVRLGSRAAGSPATTMTIRLTNNSSGIDAFNCVINVSAVPASSTASDEGGWSAWCHTNTPVTLAAATLYKVGASVSATTFAVSLCTNGVSGNWQRLIVTTTTGAPAAGDNLHIAGWFNNSTSPATAATRTVTMDQTAATDYGAATTGSYRTAGLTISNGGTLTFASVANTAYVLQVSGYVTGYSGGTLNVGTGLTPVPRGTGSATFQLDCAADGDFLFVFRNGFTVTGQGLSRTLGNNTFYTLLTADVAGGGTSLTEADATDWLNGDAIAIASTSQTASEAETVSLTAGAGASSLTVGAVTNAHTGHAAELMQAEVVLLTRQVTFKSTSTTALTGIQVFGTAQVDFDWVNLQNMGGGAGGFAVDLQVTTGSFTCSYCVLQNVEGTGFVSQTAALNGGTITIEHSVGWLLSTGGAGTPWFLLSIVPTTTGITINDNVVIAKSANTSRAAVRFAVDPSKVTLTTFRGNSNGDTTNGGCLDLAFAGDYNNVLFGPFYCHSNASASLVLFGGNMNRLRFDTFYSWRNATSGITVGGNLSEVSFIGTTVIYGNATSAVAFSGAGWVVNNLSFADLRMYGDTTFAQPIGIKTLGNPYFGMTVLSGDFGTASGRWVAQSTADVQFNISGTTLTMPDMLFVNTLFTAATPISQFTSANSSYASRLRFVNYNRTAGLHKVQNLYGTLASETSTVDVSPSLKLTPVDAVYKFDTSGNQTGYGVLIAVQNGQSPAVSFKLEKDGSYNGNSPQIVIKANPAVGITADTVVATCGSVTAVSFSTCTSSAIGPVTAAGTIEAVVTVDGTAGNMYVDSPSVTGASAIAATGLDFFYLGTPSVLLTNAPQGGVSRSRVVNPQ